jgi:hypothetical protein
MSKQAGNGGNGGGCGCVGLIASILFIWALVFGVNVNGKHYGMDGCNCNGIQIGTGK